MLTHPQNLKIDLLLHPGFDNIDEIFSTSDACNATSPQLSRDEQNVTKMIKCSNNQPRLPKNTNIFEWWDKEAESDLRRVANVALASIVTQP